MRRRAFASLVLAALLVVHPGADARAPRLLVLLMVDQMRGDYVDKLQSQWSRGLRRFVTEGAWFRQAEYPYFNTVTCAGHASVSTGATPSIHGIIINGWWDRDSSKQVTCTEDGAVTPIGYGKPVDGGGDSARWLRTSTLADELRAQGSPAGRTISFSLKARSAIMLGGHHPAANAWLDDSGVWATSTAFSKAPVPEVAEFVRANPVDRDFGKVWERTLPTSAYLYEDAAVGAHPTKGLSGAFPHALKGAAGSIDAVFYDQWQSSPFADEYLARMALGVAERMKLGSTDGRTDMIAVSFSTLDKVGHDFGPNSHEIQDVLVRLDRTLGDFFDGLDRLVGAGRYTVALTADHGVAPIPERARAQGLDAGRVSPAALIAAVERAVAPALGAGKHVDRLTHHDIYFTPGTYDQLRAKPGAIDAVRAAVRSVPGIQAAYTRDELAANRFVDDRIGRQLAHSYYPGRSGDFTVVPAPYWMLQAEGTTHGTGYAYDAHVPVLLMGQGIEHGEYLQPASPTDVAPTLAFLAGVVLPRTQGRVLTEALAPSRNAEGARTAKIK